ncbi:hypothetical protein PAXRUDRAFT_14637 [Paxillus rubicundulus Ve08.2h10]|uniref:Uncharacterized protein n=1 Tax=Paxillus rubicundulus Ve08.2h10 TaxID=930991 RepID=A0A0D0DER5_9AGAM|nr:hypothetical protein PAXRUDRAFT_14637 [Paxillus rubicundulus Ve08.2h10]
MEWKVADKKKVGSVMDIIEVDDDSTEMMPPPSRSQKWSTKLAKAPDTQEDMSDDSILNDSLDSKEHEPTTCYGKSKKKQPHSAQAAFGKSLTVALPSKEARTTKPKLESTASHHSASCAKTNQNPGVHKKGWSGIWWSPFILQSFTSHFQFIQGHIKIPELGSEQTSARTALTLASAAVYHTLMLVANKNITFKSLGAAGGSQKHSGVVMDGDGAVWEPSIPKGAQYEFNEAMWGMKMRVFLEPIMALSNNNFAMIVDEAQASIKGGKGVMNSAPLDNKDKDSDVQDLFAFC